MRRARPAHRPIDALSPALHAVLAHGFGDPLARRHLAGKARAFRLLHPSRRDDLRRLWLSVRADFLAAWTEDADPWAAVQFDEDSDD
jgi:hypothetical protein